MHRFRLVVFLLLAVALVAIDAGSLRAQSGGGTPRTPTTVFGSGTSPRRSTSSAFGAELPPIEKAIDPEIYRLGPNDQLLVTIPALEELSLGGEFQVIVSADNTVPLPRGVTINARGMTLAGFRRAVDAAYRRRGGSLEVASIALVRPRSIYVTVRGAVRNPGRHLLTAADRVSTAIDMANEIEPGSTSAELAAIVEAQGGRFSSSSESPKGVALSLRDMPLRNVTVRHNDGTATRVDLARFAAFGTDADNPSLREGDVITVVSADQSNATVGVGGAVNSPAVVEWRRGDNAMMLARLAGGTQTSANLAGAYLSRATATGQERIPIDLADSASLLALTLEPGDQLIIPASEARAASRTGFVSVEGAVGQPSAYPIVNGETKLSEVIATAGGFGPDAAINGAYIVRDSDPGNLEMRRQINEQMATIATSELTLEDTTRVKMDLTIQRNRVAADFVGLFGRGDKSKDISLRSGDRIVVPVNPGSVYVFGRVVFAGSVDYREGADAEYYIQRAGGLTSTAAASRIQVIKFGTGQPLAIEETSIEPGDRIYVAGERDFPARTPLEIAATTLGVVSSLASITWLIVQITNELGK
jgi:polysaccharide export outer membrane protein